jgi:hypothetical protein
MHEATIICLCRNRLLVQVGADGIKLSRLGSYLKHQLSTSRVLQHLLLFVTLVMTAMVLGDGVLTPCISGVCLHPSSTQCMHARVRVHVHVSVSAPQLPEQLFLAVVTTGADVSAAGHSQRSDC